MKRLFFSDSELFLFFKDNDNFSPHLFSQYEICKKHRSRQIRWKQCFISEFLNVNALTLGNLSYMDHLLRPPSDIML